MTVAFARLDGDPLSLDAHVSAVSRARDGAVVTFVGQVRNHDPSVAGEVTHLDYSAHPDAPAILDRIASASCGRGDVTAAVSHRIGLLAVGDAAIVCAVASAHRDEAFDACRDLVEQIKAQVPIWKREILADGSHTWVGVR